MILLRKKGTCFLFNKKTDFYWYGVAPPLRFAPFRRTITLPRTKKAMILIIIIIIIMDIMDDLHLQDFCKVRVAHNLQHAQQNSQESSFFSSFFLVFFFGRVATFFFFFLGIYGNVSAVARTSPCSSSQHNIAEPNIVVVVVVCLLLDLLAHLNSFFGF
jgi:hypothetical protein